MRGSVRRLPQVVTRWIGGPGMPDVRFELTLNEA